MPRESLAMFMPAHNEAANLPGVATRAIRHLESRGADHVLIIINDGSEDGTATLANHLAAAHPQLEVVHHDGNKGYGSALRSGFEAALRTGHSWIAFCDADGQFNPADVERLIVAANEEQADAAIGFRIKRADGAHRRLMGKGWNRLSRTALGFVARDVDCGFKALRRYAVEAILPELVGTHATVSPEMLARLRRHRFRVVEVGVPHYPRRAGEQSGAGLDVILRSVYTLYGVRKDLRRQPVLPDTDGVITAAPVLRHTA